MNYKIYYPNPILKDYVKYYWILEHQGKHIERVYPTGESQMIFYYRDKIKEISNNGSITSLPGGCVCGQKTVFGDVVTSGSTGILAVVFHPYGQKALLGIRAKELSGKSICLSDALPGKTSIESVIAEQDNWDQKIQTIEQYLCSLLNPKWSKKLAMAAHLAAYIQHSIENVSPCTLSKQADLSERSLQRLFDEYIGLSPSRYISVTRLNYAISLIKPKCSLTSVAHQAGYFDQPHFIRSFRQMVGMTPKTYLEKCLPFK